MLNRLVYVLLPFTLLIGCQSGKETINPTVTGGIRDSSGTQKEIRVIGDISSKEQITLYGIAQNQKGGAVLISDSDTYWIDGLLSWPDSVFDRLVVVSGYLQIRDDNPVFLDTSLVISQGIPVESEAEREKNLNRKWIVEANYHLAH